MERLAVHAMGTRFELVLVGGSSPAHLRAAGEAALEEIQDAHRQLSAFTRDSVIAHLNRAAALGPTAGPIPIDTPTWELLTRCEQLVHLTQGAFDPALGRRMQDLGLRAGPARDTPFQGGWRSGVRVDPDRPRVSFEHAGLALDLGGVAKGHALDLAAEALLDAGVHQALLHGGTSSVLALDPPAGQAAWCVALGPEPDAPVAHLKRAALSLSDLGGRVADSPDAPVSHVLDPATGEGANGAQRAAVVLPLTKGCAPFADALSADALSTAALVAGPSLPLPAHAELWTLSQPSGQVHHRVPDGARPNLRSA